MEVTSSRPYKWDVCGPGCRRESVRSLSRYAIHLVVYCYLLRRGSFRVIFTAGCFDSAFFIVRTASVLNYERCVRYPILLRRATPGELVNYGPLWM